MAKFNAATAVDTLDWDFSAFNGGEGTISEPTTGDVNRFFKNMKKMMKDVKALQNSVRGLEEFSVDEEMSDEQVTEQMSRIDEAELGAEQFQQRTIECLAELCGAKWVTSAQEMDEKAPPRLVGGSPSLEQLQVLPYRHLQAFSTWLMGEIRPKKTTPGTGP
jgi:hypothetical protein